MALGAGAAVLGYGLLHQATTDLLRHEARIDAEVWSAQLSKNTSELPALARGSAPTAATLDLLFKSRQAGGVTAFRIYNTSGKLMLRYGDGAGTTANGDTVATLDPGLAASIAAKKSSATLRRGSGDQATSYASSNVAIRDGGTIVGWLVADVDQTRRQAAYNALTFNLALLFGTLLLVGPFLGYRYSTRQKYLVERQIETMSQRDQMTGLPNKASFLKLVDRQLLQTEGGTTQCALIVCELTDAHAIDQSFGLQAAERAILVTATRLTEIKPERTEIAALERARFGLFMHGVSDAMAVLALAKELTSKLGYALEWQGEQIGMQVHAGIGLSSSDGKDAATLLRSAELALRSAQEQGTPGYGFFNPEIAQDARRRVAVQKAVADATANHSFRLDFQPVYAIRTGELNGFEALIRLHDPELGAISPAEFIPIAEQSGLINRIGAWCLEEACRIAAQWPAHLVVSVNLSPAQFYTGSLIADVRQALDQNQFPSYRLEVEITEGTLLKDSELVLQQLGVLREMGLAVALDDFGTGYSSLSYLWKFPFSKLKIDRSFVAALDEAQSARGILRSIIKLGHGLGLSVTAEGIENTRQFETLRELGCDLAQGFLLDRPARIADLAGIILRNFAKGLTGRTDATTERTRFPSTGTHNG